MSESFSFDDVSGGAETVIAQAGHGEIIEKLRVDGEFFITFYIPQELEFAVPDFHISIWNRLIDVTMLRVLLAIPREHAKTTLSKLAVVWHLYYTGYRFCVYLSNTSPIAKNACRDIMNYLKTDNHIAVFGAIDIIKESETEGIWIFTISLPNGKKKRCILRSAGANQQMRGINIDNQRPDIAVIDDVEDMQNTDSETLQKKLDRWMFGTFIKALAYKKKIIWLGNMLRKTSLLSRLANSRKSRWNPVVFGCIVQDPKTDKLIPLWEDLWPLDKLVEDFREYKELGLVSTWMCEMMNMPGVGSSGFDIDLLNYRQMPVPEDIVGAFITIDPAFGQETDKHDRTGIACHVVLEDGSSMVVETALGHMRENEIFMTALQMATVWNAWIWGIEAVAAQRVLISLFILLSANHQLTGMIEFVPLMAGSSKHSRISTWISANVTKNCGVHEDDIDITHQVLMYDRSKKENDDDLIDSCAYAVPMLEDYIGFILERFTAADDKPIEAAYGMEITSV